MDILLIFPGFIVAIITLFIYETKLRKPRNKVRFFVMLEFNGKPCLHIKDIDGKYYSIANADNMSRFGLDVFEFVDMPFEEVKEVFLNLED